MHFLLNFLNELGYMAPRVMFSFCYFRSDCKEVWVMTIRGSAFLWHQVRCLVAVLFMIGQGLESPTVRKQNPY